MKKILFASTALVGLSITGMASADVALFGDARLGIGYNILNNGSADPDDGEDLRAISRVRFGVTMTGESDAGITYGATIRADNAPSGQGGGDGQRAGNVFVSGAFGTLTFGDTNGADEQHVGDSSGGVGLTGLGDFNETPYVSNGGGFGSDNLNFANNPDARPTVRYDYSIAGFGLSASTNRDLTDIGLGGSYTLDFAGGSVTAGLGYYKFESFDVTQATSGTVTVIDDVTGEPVLIDIPGADVTASVRGGEQYSGSVQGNFEGFDAGIVYSQLKNINGDADYLSVGAGTTLAGFGVSGFYAKVLSGDGVLSDADGDDAYGVGVTFDLGGGARIAAGIAETFGDQTVADFGIGLSF